jgi:hypothetical protein
VTTDRVSASISDDRSGTSPVASGKFTCASVQRALDEIWRNAAEGTHVVLLLDGAGSHITSKLGMPEHHADLPARAPELNPVENIRQYLCQNRLSNTVFENYDAILDAACAA